MSTEQEPSKPGDDSSILGNVEGQRLEIARELSDREIEQMDADQLRAALRELQQTYMLTLAKLWHMQPAVSDKAFRRDPFAFELVMKGVRQGKTDAELALELGESVKWIQKMRLEAADMMGAVEMRKKRGRPPKS